MSPYTPFDPTASYQPTIPSATPTYTVDPVARPKSPSNPSLATSLYDPTRTLPVAPLASTVPLSTPRASAVYFTDPEDTTAVKLGSTENFLQLDPDPTGAHTVQWGKMNGVNYDVNYVKSANIFGRTMSREKLEQTETGRELLRVMEENRTGRRRDFWDALSDISWKNFVPYLTTVAEVGGSIKSAMDASETFKKILNNQPVTDEEAIAARLYLAEQERNNNATWGHTVGSILRDAPSFMFEFGLSGGALGLARKGASKALAGTGATKMLSHVGLSRSTKILADEAADEAVTTVVKTLAAETAETAGTRAGLQAAARLAQSNPALRRDMVAAVADTVEKTMLSAGDAAVTGAETWGAGITRKVAEARAEQAVASALKRSAGGRVGNSFRALGKSLADGVSRGVLDAGAWGTEASSVLFSDRTTAGKALGNALTSFFIEAPLRGAELFLMNQAVKQPINALVGETVGQHELALQSSAALNNDPGLMEKANAISLGLEFLEYASESTGRGFKALGNAFTRAVAPKLAKPVSDVAGGSLRQATAKLAKNEAGDITGVALDGLMEPGRGAEVGGIINRFVRKVMGDPEDYRANTLADETTAVINALNKSGVDARDTVALQSTIRERAVQPGLPQQIAEALGDDVDKFVKDSLRTAYREKAEGLRLRSFQQYWAADFMARHKIGPDTAAKMFERMGYDGVVGEMLEERYSDVMSELFELNGEKDQRLSSKLSRALKSFSDWDQLTAEAVGFSFPMVARMGSMRALRAIGGGNEYTRFRDTAALYLDGTRHGAVGQWRYGDYLAGHAKTVEAEQAKHDAAVQRLAEVRAARPEGAGPQWDAENIAPIENEIAVTQKAIERMNDRHQKFISSLANGDQTSYSELVNVAPLSAEVAELPDDEYNRRIVATNQHASQALSAARVLTSRAAQTGQTLYKFDTRAKDETRGMFRNIAHWAVKVGATLATGDMGIMSANPAEWTGVDRGLPEGIQLALRKGYEKIFKEELRADQQARSASLMRSTDAPAGYSYQADMDAAHERALAKFDPIARRLMAESLAAHQARMFYDNELRDAAAMEVARNSDLAFDATRREFVDSNGSRQTMDDFTQAHQAEIDDLHTKMAVKLYETLTNGHLENGRIVFTRTRDDANPIVDVLNVPKNLPTEEQAVIAAIARHIPGMANVLQAQELDPDKAIEDQVGGPSTRQEWLDQVVLATLPNGEVTADAISEAQSRADAVDPVILENIARDLNFQYDGTEEDLMRRNREIIELAVLSRALMDNNVRTYSREGILSEGDPAASPWTDYVTARRGSNGLWNYLDENGEQHTAATVEELDAEMSKTQWSPVSPRVVFTQAKVFQSSDALTMLTSLGLMRQYRTAQENATKGDFTHMDPLFRVGEPSYNNIEEADRVRQEEKELADLYDKNSHQNSESAVRLYLLEGESIDDADAMSRARERMKAAESAWYARNDEKTGYVTIADDVLRRFGVSVPNAETGISLGELNADLRGKYTVSIGAYRARKQSGTVFVPIDHGIAQNYKQSLLSALLMDAYARNRRLLSTVFDSSLREFMNAVDRVAETAQNAAKDKSLAQNIADFRAATVAHEKGQIRRPTPTTMALLIRAFALYQTEHKGNLRAVLGEFAPACVEIAKAVRNLPSFQAFNAVVDRMFGGAGLNAALIESGNKAASSLRGLSRLYAMFAPKESPTLASAISHAAPGGLSVEEFVRRVADADTSVVRTTLAATNPPVQQSPASEAAAPAAETPAPVAEAVAPAAETPAPVAEAAGSIAEQALAPSPTTVLEGLQNATPAGVTEEQALQTVVNQEPRQDSAVPAAAPGPQLTSKAEAKLRDLNRKISMRRANVRKLQAIIDGGDTSNEILVCLQQEKHHLENLEKYKDSGAYTLNDAEDLNAEAAEDGATEEEYDDFFSAGMPDAANEVTSDGGTTVDADGDPAPAQIEDRPELTESEIRGLIPSLASVARVIMCNDQIDASREEFEKFLRRFVPGMRDVDVEAFASMYEKMDQESRESEFEDLWSFVDEDMEEGANVSNAEYSNDKSVAALKSKALQNFLAFAQLVNPLTGRQFQGFFEDLRNTVARSLALMGDKQGDAGKEALDFIDRLINPRANTAGSATVRDAVFADLLSKLTSESGMPEVKKHLRALLGTQGNPLNRKAAWFLGYLMSMPKSVRRQLTMLVSSSAPSAPIRIQMDFVSRSGLSVNRGVETRVVFSAVPRANYVTRLPTAAVSAPFRDFVGLTSQEVLDKVAKIREDYKAMVANGEFAASLPLFDPRGGASLYASCAALFERHFGADSPLVSVFSSQPAAALTMSDPEHHRSVRTSIAVNKKEKSPMIETLLTGFEHLAELAGDGTVTNSHAESTGIVAFTHGNPNQGGLTFLTSSSRSMEKIGIIFNTFEASLPQTIINAEVDPERSNKPASSIAVTMRGIEPALQVFMDRTDEFGFRAVCEKFFPEFAQLDEAEKLRVLGVCRQNMCWPDAQRSKIVAKSLSKSLTPTEVYEGCKTSFEMASEVEDALRLTGTARGAKLRDLRAKYGYRAVDGLLANGDKTSRDDNTFYVPVFSGDHSSSILLSVPLRSSYAGRDYKSVATEVSKWVGLDLLGDDAKRSAVTSLEAPGCGFVGLKHNPDGSIAMKTNADGSTQPETGECRVNIIWSDTGDNESMLGTTLGYGYGLDQLKMSSKDPKSSTVKFHLMNVGTEGTYGPYLSLIKSLNVSTGAEDGRYGEFGSWTAANKLMEFLRKQRASDSDNSTSILSDFDSIKLGIANSKMFGVKTVDENGNEAVVPLMKWFFGELKKKQLDSVGASIEGEALDKLFATETNPDGVFEWVDRSDPKRSGKKKLSEILDGVRLDRVEGVAGNMFSLSYRDNNLMGFTVANVSHKGTTQEHGQTHYSRTPRNNMGDAQAMARVLPDWNADVAAELDTPVFNNVKGVCSLLNKTLSFWGKYSVELAHRRETLVALKNQSEAIQDAITRYGAAEAGRLVKDILNKELASNYVKNLRSIPIKGIDAPLVSNLSWVENGEAKTHSTSQMFKDTLQGSRTIPKSQRNFMRAHRRVALCSVNNFDRTFRYGLYLDEEKFVKTFIRTSDETIKGLFGDRLAEANLEGSTENQKFISALDIIFTTLDELERSGDRLGAISDLRRLVASVFKDHHGNYMVDRKFTRRIKSKDGVATAIDDWYNTVSYYDLFTGAVTDGNGHRTFDRSAIYEGMHDEKGEVHLYLGGMMMGLPRTPSYNGSMWLQVVRAALPVTEVEDSEGNFKPGYDAMVAPDPFTLKILGCDHDGDKTKLYMLEDLPPTTPVDTRSKTKAALIKAPRRLNVESTTDELSYREAVRGPDKKYYRTGKLVPKPETYMQVNNTLVQCLFDMARMLPVMNNSDGSSPFYTGEYVGEGTNRGAVARGTKATITANEKAAREAGGSNEGAWDSQIMGNRKVVAEKILDATVGKVVLDPVVAAKAGASATDAGSARGVTVALARALHAAWSTGIFDKSLFRFSPEGKDRAKQWLDFIYHIDGISNMTFDDIKEQVCGRLGFTSGMMDYIIAMPFIEAMRTGRLPQTDKEFADIYKKYATEINSGGMLSYVRRATDKTDNEMQRLIRDKFRGSKSGVLTGVSVMAYFGVKYNPKNKVKYSFVKSGTMPLAEYILRVSNNLERYEIEGLNNAADVEKLLARAIGTKGARRFGGLGGMLLYLAENGKDEKHIVDTLTQIALLEHVTGVMTGVKNFSKAITYTLADPGSASASRDSKKIEDAFGKVMFDSQGNLLSAEDLGISEDELEEIFSLNNSAQSAAQFQSNQGTADYGNQCVDEFESTLGDFCNYAAEANDPVLMDLATRFSMARRVAPYDWKTASGNATATGYAIAALRTVPMIHRSGIGPHNILKVLQAVANGVIHTVRGDKAYNKFFDMRRGIEDMFELMYRLVDISNATRELPLFTAFSQRPEAGVSGQEYYGEGVRAGVNKITLVFQGITEGQISEVRRLYDRVVSERELDSDSGKVWKNIYRNYKGKDVYNKPLPFGFNLSRSNLAKVLESAEYRAAYGDKAPLNELIKSVDGVLAELEKVLGKDCSIEPSALFGQLLPVYAALTSRLDRIPDSKSTSIVAVMGDTFSQWDHELAYLDANHPTIMRMLVAVDFSPEKLGTFAELLQEDNEMRGSDDGSASVFRNFDKERAARIDAYRKKNPNAKDLSDDEVVSKILADGSRNYFARGRGGNRDILSGNPRGSFGIDIFGNYALFGKALFAMTPATVEPPVAEPATAQPPTVIVDKTAPATVPVAAKETDTELRQEYQDDPSVFIDTMQARELAPKDPYVTELAKKLNGILGHWAGAKVEYHGGDHFYVRARLRGTAAERKNPDGIETLIRISVVPRIVSETDREALLNNPAWLASNANRRGDVEGRKLTAEDVKAELDKMSEAERAAYFEKWRPVGVTLSETNTLAQDWAVDPAALGVLCREIRLERQDVHPGVVYHEYFHAVFGMLEGLGVFSEEDMANLTKAFHDRKGRFSEEKAAEEFRKFVENGVVPKKHEGTIQHIFQKLLDIVKALWENITRTGVRSEDYANEMGENPLAAMILTGHALTSVMETTVEEAEAMAEAERALNDVPEGLEPASEADLAIFDSLPTEDGTGELEDEDIQTDTRAMDAEIERSEKARTGTRAADAETVPEFTPAEIQILESNEIRLRNAVKASEADWRRHCDKTLGEIFGQGISTYEVYEPIARRSPALANLGWAPGDSIQKIPFDAFEKLSSFEQSAVKVMCREARILAHAQVATDPSFVEPVRLYQVAEYLGALDNIAIEANKFRDGLLANGASMDDANRKAREKFKTDETKIVKKFNAILGDNICTRIREGVNGFMNKYAAQASEDGGDTMFSTPGMTVEERVEEQLDMVVPNRMGGLYSPQLTLSRAVGLAIKNKLDSMGLPEDVRDTLTTFGVNQRRLSESVTHAVAIDAVRRVAAQMGIDPNSLPKGHMRNIAFRAIVEMYSAPANADQPAEPLNITSATAAGAILAACGTTPAAIGASVRNDLLGLKRRYAGTTFEQVIDKFDAAVAVLESIEPTGLFADMTPIEQRIRAAIRDVETGLAGGQLFADGSRENFRLAPASADEAPNGNLAIYGNHVDKDGNGNPDFQFAARRTLDALYTALAGMKYYQQLGFEPGDSNIDLNLDTPTPISPEQTAAALGIEEAQLINEPGSGVDFYDQPYFVANHMASWLESTVRKTFGHVDVGEFMREMHNKHAGFMRKLINAENWNASVMGLDVLPTQALAAVEEVHGKFSMDNGVVRRKDGKTYYRFTRYDTRVGLHGQRDAKDSNTGETISLTENEARMCDLVLKADKVYAQGGRKVVTGIDKIRFSVHDVADESFYSREKVEARRASGKEHSDFDNALWRLDQQFPAFLVDGSNGLRTRLVRAAVQALRKAKQTPGIARSSSAITHFVINELEKSGLVVGHERRKGNTGEKIFDVAVLALDIDELERMFANSTARQKLIAAGRKEEWLTREARVEPFMKIYREFANYVKTNPWLTNGDGQFFNNFRTLIPFVRGSGVFMYNANRRDRENDKTEPEKMSGLEQNFKTTLDAFRMKNELKPAYEMSDEQTRLLAAIFGLSRLNTDSIRAMIARGDFALGTEQSRATGLVIDEDATEADVAKIIYDRLVEAAWTKEGDPVVKRAGGMSSVRRMIEMYENNADSGMALAGGVGATDEMVYRTSGVLPANAQLGHMIHCAMEGITNALAFRSTLINMLMAPDAQGRPTCYADPNLAATEAGGVPDAIWEQIARWWADSNGLDYDESQSGVQNAHAIYKALHDEFTAHKTVNGVPFGEIAGKDIDAKSITGFMAQSDPKDSKLNVLAGGYALGYAKHLLQSSRNFGSTAQRALIHRALAYSKSLSVSFSMFFPLATKWESPLGAVGAIATLGSNLSPEVLRKHPEAANALQKMFGGSGWITNDFLGFDDIIKMMDSNDPFLVELIGWASALGISLSDSRINPMEPQRAILQKDLRDLTELVRSRFGAKTAARVDSVMKTLFTKSGEKAFTYALNATKLATVAQICMKLRHEAEKNGKAFDPIRDLKRYSGYINAEIGGIDPLKYAWAHPMNRGIMNMLMFSWEWTRGAWEAGGGNIIEDVLFGGHSVTAEERKYIVGRWVRMFSTVMIGVPMMFQVAVKALAMALGHDDDDDKWWTFQNEDKACWTAFDLTPLLRAVTERFPTVAQWKKDHPMLGALLPMYTGDDRGNRTHGSFDNGRRYYMHFGKQGWEFFRWFSDWTGQFFSKLAMPWQRALEGIFGRSLSWLDRELPWNDMGAAERWLSPSLDNASANLLKAFLPFTLSGLIDRGDVGVLSVFGPVQMGDADFTIQEKMTKELKRWAYDERGGLALAYGPPQSKKFKFRVAALDRDPVLVGLYRIARTNGNSHNQAVRLIDGAVQKLIAPIYNELLTELPDRVDGDFDAHKIGKLCRAARRLGRKHSKIVQSLQEKVEKRGHKVDPRLLRLWNDLLKQGMSGTYEPPVKRRDY